MKISQHNYFTQLEVKTLFSKIVLRGSIRRIAEHFSLKTGKQLGW
jgi:hypothetical protein